MEEFRRLVRMAIERLNSQDGSGFNKS